MQNDYFMTLKALQCGLLSESWNYKHLLEHNTILLQKVHKLIKGGVGFHMFPA